MGIRENLRAVDSKALAVGSCGSLQISGRRTRIRLGHRNRNNFFAAEQRRQKPAFLILAAEVRKHPDRAEIAFRYDVSTAGAVSRHLLDRQHRVHQRAAGSPIRLRHGDAEQARLRHQLRDIARKFWRMRAHECAGGQFLAREGRDRIAKHALWFG